MKTEEAIKIIKMLYILGGRRNSKHRLTEALGVSLEALVKQVAKKPISLINPGGKDVILCGECEEELKDNWKGCPHCLTIIDWSED